MSTPDSMDRWHKPNHRRAAFVNGCSRAVRSLCLWLFLTPLTGYAQELASTPTEIKAVYTASIAQFSTWPVAEGADPPTESEKFVIGVVGDDPNDVMDPLLERIKSKKGLKIHGRPVEVVDLPAIGAFESDQHVSAVLGDCSLLFFSEDSQTEWAKLQPLLKGRPIMTVGELQGFALQGGMVEYQYDQAAQRMYMVFNMQALKEANLVVSSKLLGLTISRPINQGAVQ